MNFKLTISLLILLVGSGIAIWIASYRQSKVVTESSIFLGENPPEVVAWAYYPSGSGPSISIEKVNNRWMITAPVKALATDNADATAKTLQKLSYTGKFPAESSGGRSLDFTGLKAPKNVIRFKDAKGAEHTLSIGKQSSDGISYYATFDKTDTIYTISSNPASDVQRNTNDYRNKALLEISKPEKAITSLEIAKEKEGPTLLVRDATVSGEPRDWNIAKPTMARASSTVVKAINSALSHLNVMEFTSITPTVAGTDTPRLIVKVGIAGDFDGIGNIITPTASAPASAPRIVTLSFGETSYDKKSVFVSISGSEEVFVIPAGTFETLNKSFDNLRDRHVVPENIDVPLAKKITIDRGGGSMTAIERDSTPTGDPEMGLYHFMTAGKRMEGSAGDVALIFNAARNLTASDFPEAGDPKALELDPPKSRVSFELANGKTHEILIGKELDVPANTPAKTLVAYRAADGTISKPLTVLTSALDNLRPTELQLRSNFVASYFMEDIASIKVEKTGGAAYTLTNNGPDNWTYESGTTKFKVEGPRIMGFLSDFMPISAGRWMRTKADPKFEKGAGDIVVTITTQHEVPATTAPGTAPTTMPAKIYTTSILRLYNIDQQPIPTTATATTSAPAFNPFNWSATLENSIELKPQPPWVFSVAPTLVRSLAIETFTPPPATSTAPAKKPALMDMDLPMPVEP